MMSKKLKKILTVTIILTSFSCLYGQQIRGLHYNHAVIKEQAERGAMQMKSEVNPIEYTDGFFEDFSTYHNTVFPRSNHFTDSYAFINSTWADSMISLGVATLDAYDQYGYPWYSKNSGLVASDTLTSQPFDFVGTPPDTLFFSFFFQAGGKGDLPEGIISEVDGIPGEDALMVDFYDPADELWIQKFYTIDNTQPHQFHKVEIGLSDTFRVDGFRFRFRNLTSLKVDIEQGEDLGKFENDDMWHIDYIQLRNEKTDDDPQQLGDLTITEPLLSSLTEYTSVPWTHFSLAQSSGIERRSVPLTVKDFGANQGNPITFQREYQAYDLINDELLHTRDLEREFSGYESTTFFDDFTTGFYFNPNDSMGVLELKAFLETETEQPHENDTVVRKEIYYDHYAYDDGTAEAGFGIDGEHQDLSKIALRFRAFRKSPDSDLLRAVLIYFAKSIDSVSAEASYKIEIRKNNGGKPADEALYKSELEYTPDYSTGINEFTRIEINPPVSVSDTFFIILHQLDGYLNVGYDINNSNLNNVFLYINSNWIKPSNEKPGTPMIRASFGKYSLPAELQPGLDDSGFALYPNPARDELFFRLPGDPDGNALVQIYSITGSLLYSSRTDENSIPIGDLKAGVYLISVSPADGRNRYTSKFIKE